MIIGNVNLSKSRPDLGEHKYILFVCVDAWVVDVVICLHKLIFFEIFVTFFQSYCIFYNVFYAHSLTVVFLYGLSPRVPVPKYTIQEFVMQKHHRIWTAGKALLKLQK